MSSSDQRLGLLAHAALDVAPLAVDASSCGGEFGGAAGSSVSRHSMPSVMSASRPAALMRGPSAKPKSNALARSCLRAGDVEQRGDARLHAAGADALQALRDQAAVVGVELDDVGHGAERHESSSASSRGCVAASKRPRARSSARMRQQHVEHHAHAGDRLALERAARLVRVDDDVGVGQHDLVVDERGQVVVGHQHRDAARAGVRHALEAGDAVVHRHQQVGPGGASVERARVVGAVVAAGQVDDGAASGRSRAAARSGTT